MTSRDTCKNKMARRKKAEMSTSEARDNFKWTDDEAELLLNITRDYKVSKAAEGIDWESIQSKYADILELMLLEYPETPEAARELSKDYPHKRSEITKQVLTTKLKAIRVKFRQAVDSGRKSGHGRVVFLFFDICETIWGGSPATEQIPSGVESIDIDQDVMTTSSTSTTDTISTPGSLNSSIDEDDQTPSKGSGTVDQDESVLSSTHVQQRRELLGAQLNDYKQVKLKRKLPVDTQLLNCAKEDVQLKKKLIDQMDQMDRLHNEHMKKLSANMEKLTSSITTGFSLLQGLLYTPPQHMCQQTGYTNFNPTQQGGMPYSSGHFSDYHAPQPPTVRSPYNPLQDQPEPYSESTADHYQ